MSESQNMRN
jgi:hypothetical protein